MIFGCGYYGNVIYQTLRKDGYRIHSFLDNNHHLLGQSINGIKIEVPQLAVQYGSDTRYVIANENHADEMEKQLKEILDMDNVKIFKFTPAIN